jgi:hypothetical protein
MYRTRAIQINKIVRTRKNNGVKQHRVNWNGELFNRWLNASDFKKI